MSNKNLIVKVRDAAVDAVAIAGVSPAAVRAISVAIGTTIGAILIVRQVSSETKQLEIIRSVETVIHTAMDATVAYKSKYVPRKELEKLIEIADLTEDKVKKLVEDLA